MSDTPTPLVPPVTYAIQSVMNSAQTLSDAIIASRNTDEALHLAEITRMLVGLLNVVESSALAMADALVKQS